MSLGLFSLPPVRFAILRDPFPVFIAFITTAGTFHKVYPNAGFVDKHTADICPGLSGYPRRWV